MMYKKDILVVQIQPKSRTVSRTTAFAAKILVVVLKIYLENQSRWIPSDPMRNVVGFKGGKADLNGS
jgi:hypothetical protein